MCVPAAESLVCKIGHNTLSSKICYIDCCRINRINNLFQHLFQPQKKTNERCSTWQPTPFSGFTHNSSRHGIGASNRYHCVPTYMYITNCSCGTAGSCVLLNASMVQPPCESYEPRALLLRSDTVVVSETVRLRLSSIGCGELRPVSVAAGKQVDDDGGGVVPSGSIEKQRDTWQRKSA